MYTAVLTEQPARSATSQKNIISIFSKLIEHRISILINISLGSWRLAFYLCWLAHFRLCCCRLVPLSVIVVASASAARVHYWHWRNWCRLLTNPDSSPKRYTELHHLIGECLKMRSHNFDTVDIAVYWSCWSGCSFF